MNDLFETSTPGVGFEDVNNNHIINECIILDMLNGDNSKFDTVVESVGAFASRDGILAESACCGTCVSECNNMTTPEASSILAVAKEAGSKDYELYTKALMLMHETMERMKSQYSNIANKRLEAQKAEVMNNARIMSAVETCDPVGNR